ncbi:MAG: HAMP domain-containing histidine kinase [Bdellovibrionaceae bacterium]|nr:HAMP domain-containing histidine kinase [Bdellovibrionales bacterium]MCB9254939.1 HAMP domain-containing histidine kinase [Pseudobdellovibrionaceae bacterium]
MKKPEKRAARFDPTIAPYETERLLRDFAGVTGQQLILVLSAALGELENAALTKDPKQVATGLRVARRAAVKAQGLARNLRFYASQTVLSIETVELSQLLLDTIELVEKEFQSAGIQINVYAEAATLIVADAAALRQTLLNLLYNAKESIDGSGRITITLKRSKAGISIGLADNGRPIEGDLSEVFEPHFNAQKNADPRVLGLAVSKVLVEAMGGEIQYSVSKDGGNSFQIQVPQIHKPAAPSYRQRRRFRRVRLDLPAVLTIDKQRHPGRLKVLGKGGCLVEISAEVGIHPDDYSKTVQVEISHFEHENILVPKARIVDSHRVDSQRGVGLSFEEVGEKASHIIASLVQGHTE